MKTSGILFGQFITKKSGTIAMQRFFPRFKELPDEVTSKMITWLATNDLLNFSAASKSLRTLIDESLKADHQSNKLTLKNNLLTLWFFNPAIIMSDTKFYADQIHYFIKHESLDYWQKVIVYYLLSSLDLNDVNAPSHLKILNVCDPELMETLVQMRNLLVESKQDEHQSPALMQHIEKLFFKGYRPEYIKISLAKYLASLGSVQMISSEELHEIIELGIKNLNSHLSYQRLSAVILLNHIAVIKPVLPKQARIIKALQENLIDENFSEDYAVNINVLRLLKTFILSMTSFDQKYFFQIVYEMALSDNAFARVEVFSVIIDLLIHFSAFIDKDMLNKLKEVFLEKIEGVDDYELAKGLTKALVFVSGKQGPIFLDDIQVMMTQNNLQSRSDQEYILAKALADCIFINNLYSKDLIHFFIDCLEDNHSFTQLLALHFLKLCKYELTQDQIQFILNHVVMHPGYDTWTISTLETLQQFESCIMSKEDKCKVIDYLLSLAKGNKLYEQTFLALGDYAPAMDKDQSLMFTSLLLPKLRQSLQEDNFAACVASMKVIEKFLTSLSKRDQEEAFDFFKNQLRDEGFENRDFEIMLTAISGLKSFVFLLDNIQLAKMVDNLLLIEVKMKNHQASCACFDTLKTYLSYLGPDKLFQTLLYCFEQLKARKTEHLLHFIEEGSEVLEKRDNILYGNWLEFISPLFYPTFSNISISSNVKKAKFC